MDTTRIHDHDDTLDAHYSCLERLRPHGVPHGVPHGCMNGLVFIGHLVEDPETGEEVEVVEAVPCRRCNAGEAR
jgi:hypothetical protein